MELINHTKRQKFVFTGPRVESVSTKKAGGGTEIPINTAAFGWFLLSGEGDDVSLLGDDNEMWDRDAEGGFDRPSRWNRLDTEQYTNITSQVIEQIFAAERLARPEDFPETTYDMGVPEGFVQHLWCIWQQGGARS